MTNNIEVLNMSPIHGQGHLDVVSRAVEAAIINGWDKKEPSPDVAMRASLGAVDLTVVRSNGANVFAAPKGPAPKL